MRVLIMEDLTSGASSATVPNWLELAPEGRAMLESVAEDASRCPGWDVEVLWSRELGPCSVSNLRVFETLDSQHAMQLFRERAAMADRTLVIAPETGNRLQFLAQLVDDLRGQSAGCTPEAIARCTDKWKLAQQLQSDGFPTIPTERFTVDNAKRLLDMNDRRAVVIKPRDGAGSLHTWRVESESAIEPLHQQYGEWAIDGIVQPYIDGTPCSIGFVLTPGEPIAFPPVRQMIQQHAGSFGSALHYQGGRIEHIEIHPTAIATIRSALKSIPGLHGYVGVDFLLTSPEAPPVIVEINPRLTTSYIGYRQQSQTNLAPYLFQVDSPRSPIPWDKDPITFG